MLYHTRTNLKFLSHIKCAGKNVSLNVKVVGLFMMLVRGSISFLGSCLFYLYLLRAFFSCSISISLFHPKSYTNQINVSACIWPVWPIF